MGVLFVNVVPWWLRSWPWSRSHDPVCKIAAIAWLIWAEVHSGRSAWAPVVNISSPGVASISGGAASMLVRIPLLGMSRLAPHRIHLLLVDTDSRVMMTMTVAPVSLLLNFLVQLFDLVVRLKHFSFCLVLFSWLPVLIGDSLACCCYWIPVCVVTLSAHFLRNSKIIFQK